MGEFTVIRNFPGTRADYHFMTCHELPATPAGTTPVSRSGR